MHPCLQIDEILTVIARYLGMLQPPVSDLDHWYKGEAEEAKYPLVNMALACRAFYEPALDEHWRELDSIGKLLYCFPDGIAKIKYRHRRNSDDTMGSYSWSWSIKRVPEPHEWTRFKHHAARVRAIRAYGCEQVIRHGEHSNLTLLAIMASHFGPDSVLPGLQIFKSVTFMSSEDHLALYLLLIQPKLRMFNVKDYFIDFRPLVRCIQERAPFLEEFIVADPHNDSLTLTELSILAGMASMKRLSVSIRADPTADSGNEDNPVIILSAQCLPRLEALRISNSHYIDEDKSNVTALAIIELLRCICSSSFRQLQLDFKLCGNFDILHSLFAAIAAFSKSLRICRITIRSNSKTSSTTAPAIDEQISVGRVLSPLFSLWRSMQELDLSYASLSITAEDFTSMLASWPYIRYLLLGCDNIRTTSTITVVALGRAVSGCPHLQLLDLRIQDSEGDPFAESGMRVHNSMVGLSIRYSGVLVDPGCAKNFLRAMFPRAQIDFMSDEEGSARDLDLRVTQRVRIWDS